MPAVDHVPISQPRGAGVSRQLLQCAHRDRAQELAIVANRTAADEIESVRGALLTDDELAQSEPAWAHYPDPFGTWHQEPCADTEVPDDRTDANTRRESN